MKNLFFTIVLSCFFTQTGFSQLVGYYDLNHSPILPLSGDTLVIPIYSTLRTYGQGATCGQLYNVKDTIVNNELEVNIFFDMCLGGSIGWCFRRDTLKIPITQNNLQEVKLIWNLRGTLCQQFPNYIAARDSFLLGTTNIAEKQLGKSFLISPNPVKEQLFLKNSARVPIQRIQFYTASGKLVKEVAYKNEKINVAELTSGLYILRIMHEKGIETHKVFKE